MSRNTDLSAIVFTSDIDVHALLAWGQSAGSIGKEINRRGKGRQLLHISRFRFDAENPRTVFQDIASFASSVGNELLEPIEFALGDDGTAIIIEGHRRFLGLLYHLKTTGKDPSDPSLTIPCKLTEEKDELPDGKLLESRLIRNDEREEYHPVDEARALQRRMDQLQTDEAGLAKQLKGKFTERYIRGRLSFLNLATRVEDGVPALDWFLSGSLKEEEALEIAKLPRHLQKDPLWKCAHEELNLKALRALVKQILADQQVAATPATSGAGAALSTPAKVDPPRKKKQRSPDFAAAPTLSSKADVLLRKTLLAELGKSGGTLEVSFRIPASRNVLIVTLKPDSTAVVNPKNVAAALENVAAQLRAK